jgi:hypothetical protein
MADLYGVTDRAESRGGPAAPLSMPKSPAEQLGAHISIAVWLVAAVVTVVVLRQYE